jgi:hypothetical protein
LIGIERWIHCTRSSRVYRCFYYRIDALHAARCFHAYAPLLLLPRSRIATSHRSPMTMGPDCLAPHGETRRRRGSATVKRLFSSRCYGNKHKTAKRMEKTFHVRCLSAQHASGRISVSQNPRSTIYKHVTVPDAYDRFIVMHGSAAAGVSQVPCSTPTLQPPACSCRRPMK